MGVPPSSRGNIRGRSAGGGDLRRPPPEHSHTVHFYQAHYGPMYSKWTMPRDNDVKSVVRAGGIGPGGDAESGSGGDLGGGMGREPGGVEQG